jgi:riboflavin kinase/FMN adenylyltransferase
VYVTEVNFDGLSHKGITNIGVRPSVGKNFDRTVETFLLDFDGDLYGKNLRIDFLKFLRPEQRFDSLDKLREQIAKDVMEARRQ